MNLLYPILVYILGLISGSFLTSFTYRFPRGISFFKGRSFCPKCKNKIAWFDNIPLLSFVILKRKCRSCGQLISFRYPLVEITTATFFLLYYFSSGDIYQLVLYFLIYFLTASVFIIDLEEGIIPDQLVFAGFIISFIHILFFQTEIVFVQLFSAFLISSLMLLVHLLTKGKGMGLGDVKFVIFPGMFLIFPLNIIWIFFSFLSGAIIGLILVLLGKTKFGKTVAFGPFLAGSFLLVLVFQDTLMEWFRLWI